MARVLPTQRRSSLTTLVPDALRITNKKDIIPTVPRMLGFKHVGERVLLDAGGITTEDDQNVVALLKMIRDITHNKKEQRESVMTVVESDVEIFTPGSQANQCFIYSNLERRQMFTAQICRLVPLDESVA